MFFKKKSMVLGKRAWCQKKMAWRGAMLKQARGNTKLPYLTDDEPILTLHVNAHRGLRCHAAVSI